MSKNKITIDVVSDIACPWCYVGKRKFEAALEKWQGEPIEVNWHPYQLDPTIPTNGINRDNYLTGKFGSIENAKEMTDRLEAAGKEVGIDFDFGKDWLAVNTLPLHQLLHVAREEGFNLKLKERFLKAYFEDIQHLNDLDNLHSILAEFGWDSDKVDQIIHDKSIANAVQDEIQHYQQMGVSGVPFFVINNKYGISGAQPSEVFLNAFESVANEPVAAEGQSCEPGGGCC